MSAPLDASRDWIWLDDPELAKFTMPRFTNNPKVKEFWLESAVMREIGGVFGPNGWTDGVS